MSIKLSDAQTGWVLVPYEINSEGNVVYKKCRINKFVQKANRWSEEVQAVYADFVSDENEGLVTIKPVGE